MTPDYQPPKHPSRIRRFIRHTIEAMLFILLCLIVSTIGQTRRARHAKFSAAQADLSNFQTALDAFHIDNARYPTPAEGLNALLENPNLSTWKGPYIKKLPNDPWGTPYNYAPPPSPGKDCTLSSDGPDQRPNTPDDITPSTPVPWDPPW